MSHALPLLASILSLALAPAAVAMTDTTAAPAPLDKAPSAMTKSEITVHNHQLASTDPEYIKCQRVEETGSLVKKARVCKTNEQWRKAWAVGNQNARDTIDAMSSKGSSSN